MEKEKQIEFERNEIAQIIAENFRLNDEKYDASDFEWSAYCVQTAGYRKVEQGEWIDKPTGAYGRMQSWCSACGKHSGIGGIQSNRHKPFCPNCGAKMKGAE